MVTGISTGALIAPFAFLGAAYDGELQEAYTAYSTKDFFEKRLLLTALTSDAAVNTEPLQGLIAKYVDEEMLQTIAGEYRRGRQLFIGTTNLDAERPVIWNIGAIAVSGAPNALELFRQVVLASASIPAAFPPVFIEVEAGGQVYDEMHVDGGGTSQVFLYPAGLEWGRIIERLEVTGTPNVYVIRNAFLEPSWAAVEPRLFSIAARSIASLIRTQGIGDLYRIYLKTQRDGVNYNLAYIPDDADLKPKDEFVDPEYMRQLFDLGYRLAKAGYPWHNAPPGFETGSVSAAQ